MRALFTGTASSIMMISLCIGPSVAASKLTHEQARNECRSEFPQNRSGDKGNARTGGAPRNQQNLHECIKAKLEGRK